MRRLLLAALLAVPGSAGAALADWKAARVDPDARRALQGYGYRFQDDGLVLAPKTARPLEERELDEALERLLRAGERAALERLRVILAKERPSAEDAALVAALKRRLPPALARALDSGRPAAELRRLADAELARVSAWFDGSRTAAERREAAAWAGRQGPRTALPYLDEAEERAGRALAAAARARLAEDREGRALLSRLDALGGAPPMLVEDLGQAVAFYDYRRRAVVIDRAVLAESAVQVLPARERSAAGALLRGSKAALLRHLDAFPETARVFAQRNDALVYHELVHAWQDRREPVMRDMARGTLPGALVLEYEEEAAIRKNLYIHSRLKNAPRSVAADEELRDYEAMMARSSAWRRALHDEYARRDPAAAGGLRLLRELAGARLADARRRSGDAASRRLDEAALTRAERELARVEGRQGLRLDELRVAARAAQKSSAPLLAEYWLDAGLASADGSERVARLERAADYAKLSGDAALIAKVAAARKRSR